jgi:hypothetical protein
VNSTGETVVYAEGSLMLIEALRIVACVNAMAGKEVDVPIAKGERDAGNHTEESGVGLDR